MREFPMFVVYRVERGKIVTDSIFYTFRDAEERVKDIAPRHTKIVMFQTPVPASSIELYDSQTGISFRYRNQNLYGLEARDKLQFHVTLLHTSDGVVVGHFGTTKNEQQEYIRSVRKHFPQVSEVFVADEFGVVINY